MAVCQNRRCGKTFLQKRPWQRFCSTKCRFQEWDKEHPRKKESKAQD